MGKMLMMDRDRVYRWWPQRPLRSLRQAVARGQGADRRLAPTGSRSYSDAELQRMALRLLYQENGVASTKFVQQKRVVFNGVPFETAGASTFSGVGIYTYSSLTEVAVWVTQRYNRLYALTKLVYLHQGALPPPTPTPEGQYSSIGRRPADSKGTRREPSRLRCRQLDPPRRPGGSRRVRPPRPRPRPC